jgi:IclR family transcriptional regulator, KDG regulon repressor
VRQLKIAFDDEEMEKEIFCIGAALLKDEEIVGAFSVSLPKYRLTESYKQTLLQEIRATKDKIEAAI